MIKFNVKKYPLTVNFVLKRVKNNIRCKYCGNIVLANSLDNGNSFYCLHCDKDVANREYDIKQEEVYTGNECTLSELDKLFEKAFVNVALER